MKGTSIGHTSSGLVGSQAGHACRTLLWRASWTMTTGNENEGNRENVVAALALMEAVDAVVRSEPHSLDSLDTRQTAFDTTRQPQTL